ncbi:hypothetical protein C8J56DRAFT_851782 [Mycena floridula]|nr:hypothetical protein C8J56DRAFT_851782 [Mycena floridula]
MSTVSVNRPLAGGTTPTYYRPNPYYPAQNAAAPQRAVVNVTDDYERWYTEPIPNNRMTLSLRSGIHQDVSWALDRLTRLSQNDNFFLNQIPGLVDALFEWPEWYTTEGYKSFMPEQSLFSLPPELQLKRRHALESLFVLRNIVLHKDNTLELATHSHTMSLILIGLHNLDPYLDEHAEFLLHILDILHSVATKLVLPPQPAPVRNIPLGPLQKIVETSTNRPLIIGALTTATLLLSIPQNVAYISQESPMLAASIRYLPLFMDKVLVEACLNYLYVHLSSPPLAKAFLLHPSMPSVLKLLVSLLISEQVETTIVQDVSGPIHTTAMGGPGSRYHVLTQQELEELLPIAEPQRCYNWMRVMFIADPSGELTQVDFWNLYKDVFSPHSDTHPVLGASDVIKNVNVVFPAAQAMVLQEPVQRFIVRGVDRRKDEIVVEKFKCLWDRSQCSSTGFGSTTELYEHVLQHVVSAESNACPCLWATCQHPATSKSLLRAHLITHLLTFANELPLSQSDTITLDSHNAQYPIADPTSRPAPPPRTIVLKYQKPLVDPPAPALTALLCIRILFRTSFASSDAAPRADADHFGFPGITDEADELDVDTRDGQTMDSDRQGEKRGRKAFQSVRRLMEGVRIRDEVLMDWITEMVDAGLTGTH